MTIRELAQWRDANQLFDTWYLEINEQGVGSVMALAGVRTFASSAWQLNPRAQVCVVHTSLAGNDLNWITLRVEPENICPGCGADCEAMMGSFPGRGLGCSEWFFVPMLIFMAIWTGLTTGAIYGWLLMLFFSLPVIAMFMREKRAIWRCPNCHLTRSRQK